MRLSGRMNAAVPSSTRVRLDQLLAERGLFASRSRARDAIARGTVTVDGVPAIKAGQMVDAGAAVAVADPARGYVSRAALKLSPALDLFAIDVTGTNALDVGASTGGFTQVLLERGAAHVTAIDVGHGQLHPAIAADPRVTAIEGLNARDLAAGHLVHGAPDLIVCDVSFISLKIALPPALALAAPGARCLLLVKPQFEAGRESIGKGGLLKDPAQGPAIAEDLRRWLDTQPGWRATGIAPSAIEGADGNREFLLAGIRDRA